MEERLMKELYKIRYQIPWQTRQTILGQIKAGDLSGAEKGIMRLKNRYKREAEYYANRNG